MQYEFAAPSAKDPDSAWANSARLLNFYREPVGDGNVVLKPVPGMERFGSIDANYCREARWVNGRLYVAQGEGLYEVQEGGASVFLGSIPINGDVSIAGYQNADGTFEVAVVAGKRYFVWDGSTLEEPLADESQGAFFDIGGVEFFGQRFVLTEASGRRVQWSGLLDGKTFDGSFATTETTPDMNVRPVSVGGNLWIFKERSMEVWYATATGLAAVPSATTQRGLKDFRLVVPIPDGCFFVSHDGLAMVSNTLRASNVPVETSIATEDPQRVSTYRVEGHRFCVIHFEGRPSWVFDLATQEWHERQENDGPWGAAKVLEAYGGQFAIDNFGEVFKLTGGTDDGLPRVCRAQGRTVAGGVSYFRIPEFRVNAAAGSGGELRLRVSKDRGRTWSQPHARNLGNSGRYNTETVWRNLGRFLNFTAEIAYSGVDDVTIGTVAVGRTA